MRYLPAAAFAVTLALSAAPAAAMPDPPKPAFDQVKGTAADGARYYENSVVIEAPASKLWAAFTDINVYRLWAVPVSAIDFRLGGAIEASYDPKGHLGDPQNIRNEFIAYIPDRLLVFRNVQAPDGLPGKDDYGKTVKTLEFESLGPNRTRVTVSGMGFAPGEGFDKLYAFFSQGDGQMLLSLKNAMEK
ncbi:MAG: hypothetical protein JWN66_5039 [Sphingomonas bacterium]|jgi:uncharacterized protein YndB with AHSA1/START domain|uniref:SRPBCC family protein n=1 Tax=Sphingomonas bacterium TaxID=1895847 RepID=UPI00260ADD63|nr:SRPBCC domain-containing protein [Sphingomonas bacterium]MDB5707923.1 hypothetical protein [Sphingomonas bacterium]